MFLWQWQQRQRRQPQPRTDNNINNINNDTDNHTNNENDDTNHGTDTISERKRQFGALLSLEKIWSLDNPRKVWNPIILEEKLWQNFTSCPFSLNPFKVGISIRMKNINGPFFSKNLFSLSWVSFRINWKFFWGIRKQVVDHHWHFLEAELTSRSNWLSPSLGQI